MIKLKSLLLESRGESIIIKEEEESNTDLIADYISGGNKGDLDLRQLNIAILPDNLTKVNGSLHLTNSPIENLNNLEFVSGDLSLANSKINSFGKLKNVGLSIDLSNTQIVKLPDFLVKVNEDLYLNDSKITSLNNLEYVEGDLTLTNTKITSFEKLKKVGGLSLDGTKITYIPDFITELSNGSLNIQNTRINSLNKIKYISGHLWIFNSPLSQINEKELRKTVKIDGSIFYKKS